MAPGRQHGDERRRQLPAERESGVLELLLVSPLGEKQIIAGRLSGLWGQFAPAAVLLLAIWAYFFDLPAQRGPGQAVSYSSQWRF